MAAPPAGILIRLGAALWYIRHPLILQHEHFSRGAPAALLPEPPLFFCLCSSNVRSLKKSTQFTEGLEAKRWNDNYMSNPSCCKKNKIKMLIERNWTVVKLQEIEAPVYHHGENATRFLLENTALQNAAPVLLNQKVKVERKASAGSFCNQPGTEL